MAYTYFVLSLILSIHSSCNHSRLASISMEEHPNKQHLCRVWVVLDAEDVDVVAAMVDGDEAGAESVHRNLTSKVFKFTSEVSNVGEAQLCKRKEKLLFSGISTAIQNYFFFLIPIIYILQFDSLVADAIASNKFPCSPLGRVLVIGSGGREHAIVHSLAQSALVERIYISAGNYGTAHEDGCWDAACEVTTTSRHICENVPAMSKEEVVNFVHSRGVTLVVVGPEKPLVEGQADLLRDQVTT